MSSPKRTPILGFAAYSGTGKTTLLKKLIPELRAQGLRLAIIKHSHHDFEIDHPGKDSYELHHAGARQTLIISKYRNALISETPELQEPKLQDALQQIDLTNIDLVIVEGFRDDPELMRIELHRPALNKPLIYPHTQNVIAIASDEPLQTPITQLNLNQLRDISTFIMEWLHNQ